MPRFPTGILCLCWLILLSLPILAQDKTAQNELGAEPPLGFLSDLLLAIDERDVARARLIIEEEDPVEAKLVINGGDPTPLGEAVRIDDLNMVALLLRSGGDANLAGDGPLMEALRNDSIDMVRLLLQTGATLSESEMAEALQLTLRGKNALPIYRELLNQGADIQLALKSAVAGRKLEVTLFCLERGGDVSTLADLNVLDLNDMTPEKTREIFELAIRGGNREATLSYFLSVAATEANRKLTRFALDKGAVITVEHLSKAEGQGHDNMVLFLLELQGKELGTVIQQAEDQGHRDLAEYLKSLRNQKIGAVVGPIAAGLAGLFVVLVIAFFLRKNVLQSPKRLFETVASHNHRRLEKLLGGGADPDAEYRGEPLLHAAARREDLKMTRLLLRHKADVNRAAQPPAEEAGTAPLHLAARAGHLQLTEILVRHGADVDLRTDHDRTPLYLALRGGHQQVTHFLVQRGADIDALIHEQPMLVQAMADRVPEAVGLLLEIGADPNAAGPTGRTVLHAAAETGDVDLIRNLLDHGADIQLQDRDGRNPHALALFHRQVEAIQIFEHAGSYLAMAPPTGFELPPPANQPPLTAEWTPASPVSPSSPATVNTSPASLVFETVVIPPPKTPNSPGSTPEPPILPPGHQEPSAMSSPPPSSNPPSSNPPSSNPPSSNPPSSNLTIPFPGQINSTKQH